MRGDEQLWHMRQTTAFDPQPTSTTDGYPVVQSNDGTNRDPKGGGKLPENPHYTPVKILM
jgi:hypothetical protein